MLLTPFWDNSRWICRATGMRAAAPVVKRARYRDTDVYAISNDVGVSRLRWHVRECTFASDILGLRGLWVGTGSPRYIEPIRRMVKIRSASTIEEEIQRRQLLSVVGAQLHGRGGLEPPGSAILCTPHAYHHEKWNYPPTSGALGAYLRM